MSVYPSDGATHDDHGRLLKHTHDSVANRESPDSDIPSTLYVIGDDDTEGSVRFIFSSEGVAQVEKRINRVWNPGTLEVSTRSIRLGDNVSISALGDSLQVSSLVREKRTLQAHVNIDDDGAIFPHIVQAGALVVHNIFQPDDSTDSVLAAHLFPVTPAGEGFLYSIFVKVGAVAPVSDVTITLTDGLAPGGTVLFKLNYPASDFPANTEIQLSVEGGIAFYTGISGLLTIQSPIAFSLLGTASEIMWLAANFQQSVNEAIVLESAVYNSNLGHVLDNLFDPVYTNPVFP